MRTILGVKSGLPPRLDLEAAKKFNEVMVALAKRGLLESAHDCSEGGLAVCLAEACISDKGKELGAQIRLDEVQKNSGVSPEALFFGESQSRAVISVKPGNVKAVEELLKSAQFPYYTIGQTGGKTLKINGQISVPCAILAGTWRNSIKRRMEI